MRLKTMARPTSLALVAGCLAALAWSRAVAATPAPGLAYVSNQNGDTSVIDLATMSTTGSVSAYGTRPRGIKLSPDGRRYVVTLEFSNAFVVIDQSYRVVQTVKTGEAPYGVAFDRAGKQLFVAAARGKMPQVLDADGRAPIKDVATGAGCWHFSFTPDDRNILVARGRSNEIVVIDAQTLEPVRRIGDSQLPWAIVTYPKSAGSVDRVE